MMDLTCKSSDKMISNEKPMAQPRPAKGLFSIRDLVKCDTESKGAAMNRKLKEVTRGRPKGRKQIVRTPTVLRRSTRVRRAPNRLVMDMLDVSNGPRRVSQPATTTKKSDYPPVVRVRTPFHDELVALSNFIEFAPNLDQHRAAMREGLDKIWRLYDIDISDAKAGDWCYICEAQVTQCCEDECRLVCGPRCSAIVSEVDPPE